jgi:hypothetical protein
MRFPLRFPFARAQSPQIARIFLALEQMPEKERQKLANLFAVI